MTSQDSRPMALILAGYDRKSWLEKALVNLGVMAYYQGDRLILGENKFLLELGGQPVIQHVIDAVYNAGDQKLYQKLYVYNDVKQFKQKINPKTYQPRLELRQMQNSVAGHLRKFYHHEIPYHQRVDIFFGDTPRITPRLVERVNQEYNQILGKRDRHGNPVRVAFGVADYKKARKHTWLDHRMRARYFVGMKDNAIRVANHAAFIKDPSLDELIKHQALDFMYSMRRALVHYPKIMKYLKEDNPKDIVKRIRRGTLEEDQAIEAARTVLGKLYHTDFSKVGFALNHTQAVELENDIDSIRDYRALREGMAGKG